MMCLDGMDVRRRHCRVLDAQAILTLKGMDMLTNRDSGWPKSCYALEQVNVPLIISKVTQRV